MTVDHRLLLRQTNEVLEAIREAGLNPLEFQWSLFNSARGGFILVSALTHKASHFNFIFDEVQEASGYHQLSTYSPGPDSRQESEKIDDGWESRLVSVRKWLTALRNELETPDLWEALAQGAL
jgi:hypothetical protein